VHLKPSNFYRSKYFYSQQARTKQDAFVDTGASALSGTMVNDVRRQVHVPSPTVSTVQRASTRLPTTSAASVPTRTLAMNVSFSTPAGHRRALTTDDAPSNLATFTRAVVDPATAGLIAASTTRVQVLLVSTAAAVPLSQTPPLG